MIVMAKQQLEGVTSGEGKKQKMAELTNSLAQTLTMLPNITQLIQHLVTTDHRAGFEMIMDYLCEFLIVRLSEGSAPVLVEETRRWLLAGKVTGDHLCFTFLVYRVNHRMGWHVALLKGHTKGTRDQTTPQDQGEPSHATRVVCLLHKALPAQASVAQEDLCIIKEIPCPGPEDQLMTK